MGHRTTECLTSDSVGDVSWLQKASVQLYRRNVPLLHKSTKHPGTSLHVTQFYQAFPHISTAATNTGMRRPGYKARQTGCSRQKLHVYSEPELRTVQAMKDHLYHKECTLCKLKGWEWPNSPTLKFPSYFSGVVKIFNHKFTVVLDGILILWLW